MAKRNVGREIAISLGAAVVLGSAFTYYLKQSIEAEMPKPIALTPTRSAEVSGADHNAEQLRQLGAAWGRALRSGDYAAVHRAMAAPLRSHTSVEQLAALIAKNAYLSGAQDITIMRTTEQRASGDAASATLRGTGVLASKAGSVELTLHAVREPDGLHIVSVLLAGVPVLQAVE
jgi:hypothetical protein